MQQGLVSGYYYQIGLNGCRLGFYEPSRYYITKVVAPSTISDDGHITKPNLMVNVAAGFVSGAAGAVLASPLFLIKTRMQSYSKSHTGGAAVGEQTYYKNTWDGISKIFHSEGFKGLYRGVDAAILRTGAGSAAQLPTYYLTKSFLLKHNLAKENTFTLNFISSIMAGLGVAIVMNPWDVVLTRMYNQKVICIMGHLIVSRKLFPQKDQWHYIKVSGHNYLELVHTQFDIIVHGTVFERNGENRKEIGIFKIN